MTRRFSNNPAPGRHLVGFLVVLFILTLGIGIGTLISYRVGAMGPGDSQLKIQSDSKPLAGGAVLSLSQAFEEVANRVEPSVVNINTEEVIKLTQRRRGGEGQNPREDPFDWFHQFFNGPEEFTRRSLGSGVIVDPKGYIITNSHVVEGARKIKVSLQGGQEYTARVVATDSLSDIAVIKIDGSKEFAYARIGEAKKMKVGDWVLAIGSPFGLEQTVTAGIISATGRVFPEPQGSNLAILFNDYLQTDAAINPGNSGGPLVNMNGEVVGINTFISTTTRANAGVGFAVPSHIFVNAYNQIIDKGRVSRGYLGVNMNTMPFTPAMAKFFGVKQGSGVLITGLSDEIGKNAGSGPAAAAGMKPEDVVVELDGKKISDVQDLRLAVANTPPGTKVKVKVVRYGQERVLDVTVGERKIEQERDRDRGNFSFEEKEESPKPEIGLRFEDVPPRTARDLNIPGGALVQEVKPGSLAEEAGLIGQGSGVADVIVAANGKKVESAQDLFNLIKNLNGGEGVVLKFLRVAQSATLTYYTSITKP